MENNLPNLSTTKAKPLVVLHRGDSGPNLPDPVLDTAGGTEEPIEEDGYDQLPAELRSLLADQKWEGFINEAIHLSTMRAKGIPQTVVGLIDCLQKWQEQVNGGIGLPPLTEVEEISLQALLNLLRQEGLKEVLEELERLAEEVKLLVDLSL